MKVKTAPQVFDGEVLRVERLRKEFPVKSSLGARKPHAVHAVNEVDLHIAEGETFGVVGESGCGKSTVARMVVRLLEPSGGRIFFRGEDITHHSAREMKHIRRQMQIVFQDPFASLNPRSRIRDIIAEPLRVNGNLGSKAIETRVDELLADVGLKPEHATRRPRDFSGGQRQRVGIARALALEPAFVVLDEPVSALDVSIQAQVINLLRDLQQQRKLAYLFISHDLTLVRHICDRVAVMYLGKIVEVGDREAIFDNPSHPYTQALLSAVPKPEPVGRELRRRIVLEGDIPSPMAIPTGCAFRTRCFKAQEICEKETPELFERGQNHPVACHFAERTDPVGAST